jgi:hypothetical protein
MVASQAQKPSSSTSEAVRQQAAAGHFRAIAFWLNQPLAVHGVFVQVQAAAKPGCLQLTVEFHQPPQKDQLIRFLCHRIWLLNSPIIEGVEIIARLVGRRRALWQQRIRVVTPALKERQQHFKASRMAQSGSPLPPRLYQDGATRSNVSPFPVERHLKTLRAFVLSGSAVAAFVLGCLMEVILSGGSPVLPSFSADSQVQPRSADVAEPQAPALPDSISATQIHYEEAAADEPDRANQGAFPEEMPEERSPIVDAALEPVAVNPYDKATDPDPSNVTLLFGGDVNLDNIPYDVLEQKDDLLNGVEEYLSADVSMVNLSTSLATAATSLEEDYHQKTRPEALDVLKDGGVDIVNLSDESTMKYGEQGLDETLTALDREGIYRVGAGRNEHEARRPEILDVKGKRIAYLSYAQGGNHAAFKDRPGVNAQGVMEIAEDIRALRDEVDWIVVNYRWQTDISETPADWQTNLARLAIDQGADVVVGYHPHQLQGAEIYKGRPIAYSLGDFVFQDTPDADQDSAMLKVSLKDDEMKVEFVPVQVRDARPQVAEGAAGKAILKQLQDASKGLELPMKSPAVLKLRSKQPLPEAPANPDSPFVSPDDDEVLPIDAAPTDAEMTAPADKATPEATDTPTDTEAPSTEEWRIEMPKDDSLDQWGPKTTPSRPSFQPIPGDEPGVTSEGEPQGDGPAIRPASYQEPAPTPTIPAAHSENLPVDETAAPVQEESLPTLDGPALLPTPDVDPDAIRPFNEPLVGPLGSADQQADEAVATATMETVTPGADNAAPVHGTDADHSPPEQREGPDVSGTMAEEVATVPAEVSAEVTPKEAAVDAESALPSDTAVDQTANNQAADNQAAGQASPEAAAEVISTQQGDAGD